MSGALEGVKVMQLLIGSRCGMYIWRNKLYTIMNGSVHTSSCVSLRYVGLACVLLCLRSVVHYRIVISKLDQQAWASSIDRVQRVDTQISALGQHLRRFSARLHPNLRDA